MRINVLPSVNANLIQLHNHYVKLMRINLSSVKMPSSYIAELTGLDAVLQLKVRGIGTSLACVIPAPT